jgi:hypothetical protein
VWVPYLEQEAIDFTGLSAIANRLFSEEWRNGAV